MSPRTYDRQRSELVAQLRKKGIEDARVLALTGPSGAGKTSVLYAIAGLLRPQSGRIAIDGRTLFDSAARIDVPTHRRRIGYVFQDARLFPHRDVRGNLRYGRHGAGRGTDAFGLDDVTIAAASFVVSVFALARLLFAPAGGALITRLGERRIYLSGLLIVALSSVATGLAQNYVQLLVFRGLGGIGSTMFTVSAMGLIVRLAPPSARGRASSTYATAFLLGNIGGPIAGGFLGEFGLRVPFMVYAAALVIAAAVVWRLLPATGTGSAVSSTAAPPMLFSEALRDSAFQSALLSGFANGWSNFGVRVALLPLFAAAALDSGPWAAGAALAVFAVGNAVALTVAGQQAELDGDGAAAGSDAPVVNGVTIPAYLIDRSKSARERLTA